MSSRSDLDQNKKQLKELSDSLELQLLDEKEFNSLCERLAKKVDWPFHGTDEEYKELIELINRYTNF
jgi:hypothetical protein